MFIINQYCNNDNYYIRYQLYIYTLQFDSYSLDAKITGNSVFSLKKMGVVDFCLMTPSTYYGICTNNSIQVIDSLFHSKRQVVFKTVTNQTPIAL